MTPKGLFVSFEGIDGSGKSTQARLLADALRAQGYNVVLTREPGGSPGAEEIRALVLQGDPDRWSAATELLLFTAARRDHLERTIQPALAAGKIVICDRFADSTRMYQGLSRGDLRGKVDALHDLMIGQEPDVTLLIDMPAEIGLLRSLLRLADAKITDARTRSKLELPLALAMAGGKPKAEDLAEINEILISAGSLSEHIGSEARFESFGLNLQEQMRAGFLALAQEFPDRIRVIDGSRPQADVAADVRASVRPHLT